ncbi:MAG TPA: NAD(P)-dependent oxidoreductase [Gammaproteobacteria bacterium]|jgi:NADP-dependent 3-hydroxy acid dehydrogenase YdfG|nr:NAD(P)-dependent oxidoreductase [Gammaproteobacteria bacterium]
MEKTILITGASSGFGEACARAFATPENTLILAARSFNKLETLASELTQAAAVHSIQLDVTNAKAITQILAELPPPFQKIDILINNAGLALGLEPAHEAILDDWETMIDTNIKGLVRMTRAILPGMVERDRGHIINIGSIAGSWPYPGGNVYGATKAFVQQFSRSLRSDVLGKQIRVSNIDPGLADTNFSTVRMKGDRNKADQVYADTKPLTAKDIAEIILWITSVPAHVNINSLEVMPTCQAWGPLLVNRDMADE